MWKSEDGFDRVDDILLLFNEVALASSGHLPIFISCHRREPVGEEEIAQRALEAMGIPSLSQGYDLLTKNCHQFCQYCVTGKVDNGFADFTFSNLEGVLQHELDMDGWRVWDGCWRG